jgi:GH24 family phage-related lysozyme (muramidase)
MFTMMEELKYRIKEHEGFRDTIYQDHLGNATVGWGHLVTSDDNFQVGITYPEEVLEAVFEKDFKRAREGADQLCKDLPVNYIVRGVIVEMCLSSVVKTGAEVFQNRQESKRLESVAEKTYMAKMATGEIDYQKAVMDNNNNGWKDELVLIMVCLPIVILAWSIFSGDPDAKQKLDMFFEYFNNFPEFYKWLVLGIFGSIYGLKPGMDLIKKK